MLETSDITQVKFNGISYNALIENAVMTAQLVQELPALFSKSLNISADDVIVVSITRSNQNISKRKKRDVGGTGIVVTMAIPETQVAPLKSLIADTKSSLYSPDNGQLPKFIDSSYPVQSQLGNIYIYRIA
jgi:hypothetical protein